MVSVDVKHHVYVWSSELRSCVRVEVDVLTSLLVSVDVKNY